MLWIPAYTASIMEFLWTVPLNSGIPARISSGDLKTRNGNVNQSAQTFGMKRFKANGSHMPYRHGYIFSWQSVSSM
jgi:hypothetical protein